MNQKPVVSTSEQDLPIVGEDFVCVCTCMRICVRALSLCLHLIWVCLQDCPYSLKLLLILSLNEEGYKN